MLFERLELGITNLRSTVASNNETKSKRNKQRTPWADVSEGRRRNMRAVKSTNTKPERTIREMLHSLGYRFRLHKRDLPGKPDIVFTAKRKAIEVRGCFWHGHGCHPLGLLPKARPDYWRPKISQTKERDTKNMAALREAGWEVLELWECCIRKAPDDIKKKLRAFLGTPRTPK
jgi:DNA mismatch endonuclease Vsr